MSPTEIAQRYANSNDIRNGANGLAREAVFNKVTQRRGAQTAADRMKAHAASVSV